MRTNSGAGTVAGNGSEEVDAINYLRNRIVVCVQEQQGYSDEQSWHFKTLVTERMQWPI